MNITEIKSLAACYGLRPNKKLGQNFLIDEGIRLKIINAVIPGPDDRILEIGPGLGSLTELLAGMAGTLTAVEIDAGLYRYLMQRFAGIPGTEIIHGDFLKTVLTDDFTKIVSNLPYYCASEILFRILNEYQRTTIIYVMLQSEMAERIIALPGTPNYGALTVSLNYYCVTKKLFRVPSGCFYPRPDVSSMFIRMERKKTPALDKALSGLFHNIVRSAFWGRRKTMLTSLSNSPHLSFERDVIADVLSSVGLNGSVRGEDLGLDDFISITKGLYGHRGDDAGS